MTAPQKAYARYMSEGESGWIVCYAESGAYNVWIYPTDNFEGAHFAFQEGNGYCIARNGVIMVWRKADE